MLAFEEWPYPQRCCLYVMVGLMNMAMFEAQGAFIVKKTVAGEHQIQQWKEAEMSHHQ